MGLGVVGGGSNAEKKKIFRVAHKYMTIDLTAAITWLLGQQPFYKVLYYNSNNYQKEENCLYTLVLGNAHPSMLRCISGIMLFLFPSGTKVTHYRVHVRQAEKHFTVN